MPVDLPARSHVQAPSDDSAKTGQALLMFYGCVALAALLLIALEVRFGTFDGLTVPESIVKATGTQLLIDGIDPNWASRPPL
jgi:hypothetical protein